MRLGKIALWVFIAFIIAGIMFGFSFLSDVSRAGGWDKMIFGVGTQYEINDIKEIDLSTISRIELSVSSSDTYVIVSDSQKVRAALTGYIRTTSPVSLPHLEMTASGNTLYITEKRLSSIMIGFYSSNVKLDITIPSSFKGDLVFNGSSSEFTASQLSLNSLALTTSSGDLKLGNVELVSGFTVQTSSGTIEIEKLSAASALLSTSSGDKKIKSLTVSGEALLKSSSGETTAEKIMAGNIEFESSNGDIRVGSLSSSKAVIKSSSGEINFDGLEGDAYVVTTSGDINLKSIKPESQIKVDCSSGSIKLSLPSDTQLTLNVRTSSGDIQHNLPLQQVSSNEDFLKGTIGNGKVKVDLTSTSGDITIN